MNSQITHDVINSYACEFWIITLFPRMFSEIFSESILFRAREKKLLSLNVIDLREHCFDKHRTADDAAFGGGPGMVLKAEPIAHAIRSIPNYQKATIIVTSASGQKFSQDKAQALCQKERIVIVCGHYEGIDQRVVDIFAAEEICIGDFVLTGGELPAMVIVDAVARNIPGVLGKAQSLLEESFQDGLLEGPHYTRPRDFENLTVPEVLLSGNHQEIAAFRRIESLKKTIKLRPDLMLGNKPIND